MEDLLLQLKDISPPHSPGWLPPAPGWWFVIAILCLSIAIWLIVRQRRRLTYFRLAMAQLDQLTVAYKSDCNTLKLAMGLSRWIRQVALLAYPQRQVAGLTGARWVSFLEEPMTGRDFTEGPGYIFAGAVYAGDVDVEAPDLLNLCRRWLITIKPQLVNQCSA
jgi:hypothetical protein